MHVGIGNNIIHIGFSTIRSFRHPRGSRNVSPSVGDDDNIPNADKLDSFLTTISLCFFTRDSKVLNCPANRCT